MNYLGVDQSLCSTGIVILDTDYKIILQKLIKTEPHQFSTEIERLIHIKNRVREIIDFYDIKSVYMENFAYGARGASIFTIGGLGYLLRELYYEEKIPLTLIAPATLKKYASDKGNCKKNLVLMSILKKWHVEINDDNIADAYILARMAVAGYSGIKTHK